MEFQHLFERYVQPLYPISTGEIPGGSLRSNAACVLFDVYGTLFISGSGDTGVFRNRNDLPDRLIALFREYRPWEHPQRILESFYAAIQAYHRELRGQGVDFPEVDIEAVWARALNWKDRNRSRELALAFELVSNPVYPMPHLQDMLAACRRASIRMGIISNAQFYTPLLFSWFLGAPPTDLGFDPRLVFYSYQSRHAKPSRVMFETAARRLADLSIPAHSVLYVGNDIRNDIQPARKIGFQTALFAGDRRSLRRRAEDPGCRDTAPDVVITDLAQIIHLLACGRPL